MIYVVHTNLKAWLEIIIVFENEWLRAIKPFFEKITFWQLK